MLLPVATMVRVEVNSTVPFWAVALTDPWKLSWAAVWRAVAPVWVMVAVPPVRYTSDGVAGVLSRVPPVQLNQAVGHVSVDAGPVTVSGVELVRSNAPSIWWNALVVTAPDRVTMIGTVSCTDW